MVNRVRAGYVVVCTVFLLLVSTFAGAAEDCVNVVCNKPAESAKQDCIKHPACQPGCNEGYHQCAGGEAFDFNNFVWDKVRLYYYTDVRAILHMLHPEGFTEFTAGGGDLTAYQEKLITQQGLVESRRAGLIELQNAYNSKVDDYQRAVANNNLIQKKTAAADATADQLSKLADEKTAASEKKDAAKTAMDKAAADVKSQREQLETAQACLRVYQSTELQMFAIRRDFAPVYCALGNCACKEFFKRVYAFGLPDSNEILLIGDEFDVEMCKRLIKEEIDTPAPQARMTIWALEMNYETGKHGDRKANEAMQDMKEQVDICRQQVSATLTILRDTIIENVYEKTSKEEIYGTGTSPYARFLFYDPYVLAKLGFDIYKVKDRQHPPNYKPNSIQDQQFDDWSRYLFTKYTIPDPGSITTLGECITVLVLAKHEYRKEVLQEFEDRLTDYLTCEGLKPKDIDCYRFSRLRRYLACDMECKCTDGHLACSEDALRGTQELIENALIRKAISELLPRFYDLKTSIDNTQQTYIQTILEFDKFCSTYSTELNQLGISTSRLPRVNKKSLRNNQSKLISEITDRVSDISKIRSAIKTSAWSDIDPLVKYQFYEIADGLESIQLYLINYSEMVDWVSDETLIAQFKIDEIADERIFPYDPDAFEADIARADEVLKQFNQAMEDDMDEFFVQPMLSRLRYKLEKNGMNVGVVQRTSILSTNRLVARISPQTSASLEVGEMTDVLAATNQITQVLLNADSVAQSALTPGQQFKQGIELLRAFEFFDAPGEIYGVTSGNTFQITPVFEPGGQSLRFRFDYVYSNRIKDPDGTAGKSTPNLPRFENTTINTEVQLSNFEIRPVAQFESNVQFGLPKKRSGGIPGIKELPIIRDIPLVGYTKKSGGKNAVVQQNIIFAQTTIYPTIDDIKDVLTEPVPNIRKAKMLSDRKQESAQEHKAKMAAVPDELLDQDLLTGWIVQLDVNSKDGKIVVFDNDYKNPQYYVFAPSECSPILHQRFMLDPQLNGAVVFTDSYEYGKNTAEVVAKLAELNATPVTFIPIRINAGGFAAIQIKECCQPGN